MEDCFIISYSLSFDIDLADFIENMIIINMIIIIMIISLDHLDA